MAVRIYLFFVFYLTFVQQIYITENWWLRLGFFIACVLSFSNYNRQSHKCFFFFFILNYDRLKYIKHIWTLLLGFGVYFTLDDFSVENRNFSKNTVKYNRFIMSAMIDLVFILFKSIF